MFSEYSEIIVAVIAAAVSAFATYMFIHIKKPDALLHDDKNEWRLGLREWITRFSNIKLNAIINSTKGDSISSLRDDLLVRLNPITDKILKKQFDILEIIYNYKFKNETFASLKLDKAYLDYFNNSDMKLVNCTSYEDCFKMFKDLIIENISQLLKSDWERGKMDSTLTGRHYISNIIFLYLVIAAFSSGIARVALFDDYEFYIVLLSVAVAYKLSLAELNKSYIYRMLTTASVLKKFGNLDKKENFNNILTSTAKLTIVHTALILPNIFLVAALLKLNEQHVVERHTLWLEYMFGAVAGLGFLIVLFALVTKLILNRTGKKKA